MNDPAVYDERSQLAVVLTLLAIVAPRKRLSLLDTPGEQVGSFTPPTESKDDAASLWSMTAAARERENVLKCLAAPCVRHDHA